MAKIPEVRKYQRILPSEESQKKLEKEGFEWVMSSNVSGAKNVNGNLFIRFHNGSIYKYPNKGRLFENLIAASSKGKWVWRFLRRPDAKFERVGSLPLPEDRIVPDSEIVRPQGEFKVSAELPTFEQLEQGQLPRISIERITRENIMSTIGGGFTPNSLSTLIGLDQIRALGIIA